MREAERNEMTKQHFETIMLALLEMEKEKRHKQRESVKGDK